MPRLDEEAARAELQKLAAEQRLEPETVVATAADPQSPLHLWFEWDDAEAAHAHRVDQARRLIRRFKTVVEVHEHRVRIPSYVRNPTLPDSEAGYVETLSLKNASALAREAVLREFRAAASRLERARNIATALGQLDDFDQLVRQAVSAVAAAEATLDAE